MGAAQGKKGARFKEKENRDPANAIVGASSITRAAKTIPFDNFIKSSRLIAKSSNILTYFCFRDN
jgi:hypothetical protein